MIGKMKLQGKTAIITGAAGGLGTAMSNVLAENGANLALLDINEECLRQLKEELTKYSVKVETYAVNVTDFNAVQTAGQKIFAAFGRVDILVNNAGGTTTKDNLPLFKLTKDAWDRLIALNLSSVFNCVRMAVPKMVEQRYGKVINISSVAGLRGGGLLAMGAYAAAKGGVIGLTKMLAREVGPYGVHVNSIAPGLHLTLATQQFSPKEHKRIIDSLPLRTFGQPEKLAQLVLFLASDDAQFITGDLIAVDGGYSMH